MRRKRTARPKLSPKQFLKGTIIRLGLARKVKVRNVKGPDGTLTSRIQFQLIWSRVALVFVAFLFLAWIAGSVGGYIFVRVARKFPEVKFVDIAFPHRWENYRVSLGDYYIEQAVERLEAGETDGVLQFLRVGVNQSPDNTQGRLILASIYNMIGRPDLGIDLLQERVAGHAEDLEYLNALISLLFANHEDQAVEELADQFLAGSTEPTERNLVLAIAAATANFNRANYGRAQEIVDSFDLTQSRTGTLLQARIAWETGETDRAIQLLERVLADPGDLEDQVVDYMIDYLWKSGREDRAERVALSRSISDPLAYSPRLRLLYIYHKREETAKEAEAVEALFELFGREEPAIHGLGEFAAWSANPGLAERVYNHALRNGFSIERPSISLLEAHVAASNYQSAVAFYEAIQTRTADWTPLQQARLKPIVAAAFIGTGNAERGDGLISEVMQLQRGANPEWLVTLSERLVKMNERQRARRVLEHVMIIQPLNQDALTRLIHLDLDLGNNSALVRNIERLLKMRKPSLAVLENARDYIGSDRFLFQSNRETMLRSIEDAIVSSQLRDS